MQKWFHGEFISLEWTFLVPVPIKKMQLDAKMSRHAIIWNLDFQGFSSVLGKRSKPRQTD